MAFSHFIISGSMRSGTTLISSILNSHPEICLIPDIFKWFWDQLYNRYGDFNTEYELERALYELENFIMVGLNRERIELLRNRIIQDEIKKEGISYKSLFDKFIAYYSVDCSNRNKNTIGMKATQQHNNYETIINSFYNFFIIHMVRNSRDTYYSHKNYSEINPKNKTSEIIRNVKHKILKNIVGNTQFRRNNIFKDFPLYLFDEWSITQKKALEIKNKYPKNIIIIRYEDLIENPEKEVKRILTQLGLKWNPSLLEYKKFKDRDGNKFVANSSFKDVKMGNFDKSRIYNSFDKLNKKELMYYSEKAIEFEKQLGYDF